MTWSDRELAEALEGLLDPDVAEALEAEVACDAELAARQAALAAVLREPVQLPTLIVPGGLEETTRERLFELPRDADLALALEGEGSQEVLARDPARARALRGVLAEGGEEELPELAPSPGLAGRILGHLEAEGLVAASEAATPVPSDGDLAALLEGVLSPAEAALLERALGRDSGLRARFEALAGVLGDREELAFLPLPPSLGDAIGERLLDEGLVREELVEGANLPVRPPADLMARTLGRLEAAALIEPLASSSEALEPDCEEPTPRGLVLPFPGLLLSAAALLLLGLGLGYRIAPQAAPVDSRNLALAQGEADQARRELGEVTDKLSVAREALQGAARERARDVQELLSAKEGLVASRGALHELERQLKTREASESSSREALEQARAEVAAGRALLARREGALEELRGSLSTSRSSLAKVQASLRQTERALGESQAGRQEAETQRALAQAEVENLTKVGRATGGMRVADAAQIESWDADRQLWQKVGPQETLPPGSIVRGLSAQSTLQVSGLLPYQLRSGVYVIRDGQRLVPLPDDLHGEARGVAEPAPDDALAWIERLQSPAALERSRASQALRAQFYALGGEGQPPTTSAGWTRWWSQARRVARR